MVIWSGGQTGVDRAAWDAATELGLSQDGWVPLGRLAEDGRLSDRYHCRETHSREYSVRTEKNLREADITLILCFGEPTGGTAATIRLCGEWNRPHLVINVDVASEEQAMTWATEFVQQHHPQTLNVAGPRGSSRADIYPRAKKFLLQLFRAVGAA